LSTYKLESTREQCFLVLGHNPETRIMPIIKIDTVIIANQYNAGIITSSWSIAQYG